MWCNVRHLNLIDKDPQRITKRDKELVSKLMYNYGTIKVQDKVCIEVFCYQNKLVYPVYLSNQKFSDGIGLLLISNEFKSH